MTINFDCKECHAENTIEVTYVPAFKGSFGQGADEPPYSAYFEDAPDEIRCLRCDKLHSEDWIIRNYLEEV